MDPQAVIGSAVDSKLGSEVRAVPRKTHDAPLSWRLIAFEEARIESPGDAFYSYLVVSGVNAYANIRVELMPLVYVDTPDYWGVEVTGAVKQFALPAVTPYEAVLPLDFAGGKKGIEVIGAYGQRVQLDFEFSPRSNPDPGVSVALMDPLDPKRVQDYWNPDSDRQPPD